MSWSRIVAEVAQRATGRCEYCRMHQSLQGATFHVEHIVPTVQGGSTALPNLAWACPGCDLHKSDRTEVTVPDTGESVSLFNPREHAWSDHFAWDACRLLGLTAIGHATIVALDLNHERRLRIRQAEQLFGLFPPADE